ncbi:CHRD domain-containing protein [Pseudorhodobacter sp.]|uniref:CHRD domain-containing protein n=1 Tax=Pseudorhodobacter sp. TaxID=1934400 RepID=UPI002AFDE3A5|nr:CHRD domain-containing protein [Pseudorhodobacter sp.]
MLGKLALSSALILAMSGVASAETINWIAALDQAQEVDSKTKVELAGGNAEGTLDTETGRLNFNITFTGLSGDVVGAHFHGPADVGMDASPVVDLNGDGGLGSPIVGFATITPAQIEEVKAGKWYINLHTEANPAGEIRGQVAATQ